MEWRQNVEAMPKKLEDVVLEDRLPKLVLEMPDVWRDMATVKEQKCWAKMFSQAVRRDNFRQLPHTIRDPHDA